MNNKEQILVDLKEKLKTIPKKPGCYQYKDKDGTIFMLGKLRIYIIVCIVILLAVMMQKLQN